MVLQSTSVCANDCYSVILSIFVSERIFKLNILIAFRIHDKEKQRAYEHISPTQVIAVMIVTLKFVLIAVNWNSCLRNLFAVFVLFFSLFLSLTLTRCCYSIRFNVWKKSLKKMLKW